MNTAATSLYAVPAVPGRAAIYVRISKDDEDTGLGVARQEKEVRELLARLGWGVAEVICDNDISASRFSRKARPGWRRLLDGLVDGTFDGVAAWDSDRMIRQPKELEELIDIIGERNVVPVQMVTSGTYDLVNNRLEARIKASVAADESDKKSKRLKAQRRQAAASGIPQGGKRPFGFMANGIDHHPVEAPALVQAVEDLLDGAPVSTVANRLGVSRSVLRAIVTGPRIAGLRQHQGEIIGEAAWKPIIPRATWERLRATLADPGRRTTRPGRVNLLAGMMYTSDGVKMTTRSDKRTGRRYSTPEGVKPSCSIDGEQTEAFVVAGLLAWSDRIKPRPVKFDKDAEIASLEVARLDREIAELVAARKARRIKRLEVFTELLEDLETKRAAELASMPPRRVPTAAQSFFTVPGAWRTEWEQAEGDFARRRELVASVVDRVEIGPVGKRRVFDTERIHVVQRTP